MLNMNVLLNHLDARRRKIALDVTKNPETDTGSPELRIDVERILNCHDARFMVSVGVDEHHAIADDFASIVPRDVDPDQTRRLAESIPLRIDFKWDISILADLLPVLREDRRGIAIELIKGFTLNLHVRIMQRNTTS